MTGSASDLNVENKDGAGRSSGGVGRSKIDREQWPDILARRHRGDSIAAIGRVYGVTPSAISYILKKAHADSEMPAPAEAKIDPAAGEHNGTTANAAPANGASASTESNQEVSVTASSTPATTSASPAPEAASPGTSSQTAETGAGEPRRSRESGGEAAPRRLSSGTLSVNRESGRAKTRQTAEAAPGAQPPAAAQRTTAPAGTGESGNASPAGASGPAQPTGQAVSAGTGQSELSQRLLTAANALAQSWDADASGDDLGAKAHELRRALAAIEIADSKRSSRKRKAAEPPVEPEPPREAPGPREPLPLEEETETAPEGTSLGTIKFYKPSKGFGFVVPDDGGQDIYLAAEVVEAAGAEDLQTGDRVAVERGPGRKGEEVKSLQLVGS